MADRLPPRRVHTGDRRADDAQKQAHDAAMTLNRVRAKMEPVLDALARETRGLIDIYMNDADYRLSAEEAAYGQFNLHGAHTAVRTLWFPRETDATSRVVWLSPLATGGFDITVATLDGTYTLPSLTTKAVRISGSGPAGLF